MCMDINESCDKFATAGHDKTVKLYDEIDGDLIELTRVQTEIGKELLAESIKSQSSSSFISQLQIIIAIILGLIIMILIITDKQVLLKQEKYNLN